MESDNEDLTKQLELIQRERDELQRKYDESQREREALQNDYDEVKQLLNEKTSSQKSTEHSKEFWSDIRNKCNDTHYIQQLIKDKQLTMNDVNDRGWTLLFYASWMGAYDTVKLCINLGADVNHKNKNGNDALYWAKFKGYADIEQLLVFAALKANIGDRIRWAAKKINKESGIMRSMLSELGVIGAQSKEIFIKILKELMIETIKKKLPFFDEILSLCFDVIVDEEKEDILSSDLWTQITKTCESIISNGNKRDWVWMKEYIVPSGIWYKKLGKKESDYLYFKLFEMTKLQEINLKNELETNMENKKNENIVIWNKLVEWKMDNDKLTNLKSVSMKKEQTNIRQDNIPNGIQSDYSFNDLTERFVSSSSSFNAHKFYDLNQYLPRLQMLAQTVDDEFHESVQRVFGINPHTKAAKLKISNDEERKYDDINEGVIGYTRGPVKLQSRAKNKAENDYFDQVFPTTACVLDLNRCTITFNEIETMLFALKLFIDKVYRCDAGNIIQIVRLKNGFVEYAKQVQYADIKMNVIIKGPMNMNIIGEVQLLINDMVKFKKQNHSLYAIQREEEYFKNSVSNILPNLLNQKQQILVAAQRGNIEVFRSLVVDKNETEQNIMIYNDASESILDAICANGHIKVFEFLQSVIETNLFIKHLCETQKSSRLPPIVKAIKNTHLLLINKILRNEDISNRYKTNDAELFKMVYWLFRYAKNNDLIDSILSILEISKSKIKEFINYKSFKDIYQFNGIINDTVSWNPSLNTLRKLVSIIGHKDIKHKYQNIEQDEVFKFIYCLFFYCKMEGGIDWVLKEFDISNEMVIKSMDYQFDFDQLIIGRMSRFEKINNFPKLLSVIGEKCFFHHIFVSDKYNRNSLENAIFYNSLLSMKYFMKFKEIKTNCLEKKEILWRIIYWMIKKGKKSTNEYLMNELKLNEEKLKEIQSFKCTDSFDYDKWGDTGDYDGEYWNETISDDGINKLLSI